MKSLVVLLAFALSGCATTRVTVVTPAGIKVRASFPKNMDASKLTLKVGEYELTADRIVTDASGVVREKNVGVSAVADAVSDAAKLFAPTP